jgi:arabinogalactan endo-1,4-beta-galactosidase
MRNGEKAIAPLLVVVLSSHALAQGFMYGADVSSLPIIEARNAVYTDDGQPGDALEILNNHGTNWFRLRLFVDPQMKNNFNGNTDLFVAQDLEYTIGMAQRIKQLGGNVLLDLHYSDTWCDPCHQWKPAAWQSLSTLAELEQQVYDYTKQTIEAFRAAGVVPEMVQIGNEISAGMLWNGGPGDDCETLEETAAGENSGYPWLIGPDDVGFDRLAALLDAGMQGARDGATMGDNPAPAPKLMIHHDRGDRLSQTDFFLKELLVERGLDFDVIGFSYYPLHHYDQNSGLGSLADVEATLNHTAETFGLPIVIAETGFTQSNEAGRTYEFPETPAGQQEYLEALVDVVEGVSFGLGRGVFWWYAEARPVSGLGVWQNGRYGLFDASGELLPAADAFNKVQGDYNGDGTVNAADYTVWRDALGQEGWDQIADGDADGRVDIGDYHVWKRNFGRIFDPRGGAGALAVPEPLGFLLAIQAWAVVASRPRRRR